MTDYTILDKAFNKAIDNGYHIETLPTAYAIIFTHSFAKAFWGEYQVHPMYGNIWKERDRQNKIWGSIPCWKWHLSKMVLEEKPLQYLERFL